MHLMYTLDANGNRLYTLKKVAHGQVTKSAHPARFSPDDKWSRQRVTLKKRFNLLLSQQSKTPPSPSRPHVKHHEWMQFCASLFFFYFPLSD